MLRRLVLIGALTIGAVAVPAGVSAAQSGTAYRWGVFEGKVASEPGPTPVSGLSGISYVNAGNSADYFIAGGALYASGENESGQLGQGYLSPVGTVVAAPEVVPGLSSIVQVANGANFAVAINSSGAAFGWGANGNGNLCLGNSTSQDSPQPISALAGKDVVGVAAGGNHSAFLLSDGTVWSCGANANGQLGDGSTISSAVPVQAVGVSGVSAITAGSSFTTALIAGTLWDWGNNSNGELGSDSTAKYLDTPVQVVGLTGVVAFAAGGNSGSTGHQVAVESNGSIWAWGDDLYGQLGDGKGKKKVKSPVKAKLLSAAVGTQGVSALACGAADTFLVDGSGDVYAVGEDVEGSLGDGSTGSTTTPVLIDRAVSLISTTSDNALDYRP